MFPVANSNQGVNRRLTEISDTARSVHVDTWRRRAELWKGNVPTNLVDLLEPGVALVARGYRVQSVSSLGEHLVNGVRSEVAGTIDHGKKIVFMSQRFSGPVQRFTLAHELGHAMCHPTSGGMHRDVPVHGSGSFRDRREVEADHFASNYLMPERLLRGQFGTYLRPSSFHLTDEIAYALCGTDADQVRQRCRNLRGFSLLVAGTGTFNGKHFLPLASQFKVSQATMAIRLEELGLVGF